METKHSEEYNASIFRVTSVLKMEEILPSKTFVTTYQTKRYHIPEAWSSFDLEI
jgi:hypothetical protein